MTQLIPDADVQAALAKKPPRRKPPLCEECGLNPADLPSKICVGCHAYREHTI